MFIDGKNTMSVTDIQKLESHTGGTLHRILGATGRAKPAVATEWNEFEISTVGARVHCTAKGRVTTVDHFVNVFHC